MNTKPISKIILKITNSDECLNAVWYYKKNEKMSDQDIQIKVLERGSTDFDRPYKDEQSKHKVRAYIHYYMERHYQDNLNAFESFATVFLNYYLHKQAVFIDFGCGPMTSGFALLKHLNKLNANEKMLYCGVDISNEMRQEAQLINAKYELFANAKFLSSIEEAASTVRQFLTHKAMVVMNFSYVLSGWTYKHDIANLISAIHDIGNDVSRTESVLFMIYHNPIGDEYHEKKHGNIHGNWKRMQNELGKQFIYTSIDPSGEGSSQIHYEAALLVPNLKLAW